MVEPTQNEATQSTDPLTSSEAKLDDDQTHDSVELNGDQSQLPNGVTQDETQDTQDITMSDQPPTSNDAGAPESRIPTKKDATLREFLSKMDDYAPIVRASRAEQRRQLLILHLRANDTRIDTRCRHKLLLHSRRPPTTTHNAPATGAPTCSRYPEIYRRRRSRCVPVFAHPRL
jgi:hypothetical protein